MKGWFSALPALLRRMAPALLLVCLLVSAVAVVAIKQQARALNTDAQALVAEREKLEVEYNQLRLERGTIGAHSRVGEIATHELNMRVPDDYAIVQVPAAD